MVQIYFNFNNINAIAINGFFITFCQVWSHYFFTLSNLPPTSEPQQMEFSILLILIIAISNIVLAVSRLSSMILIPWMSTSIKYST